MSDPQPVLFNLPQSSATVRVVPVRAHQRRVTTEHPYGPPAQAHSESSGAAAQSVKGRTELVRQQIVRGLMANGPQTDEELQWSLRLEASTERPRRVELVRDGRVRDSGQRRATKSGRSAVVWELSA